MLLNTCGTQKPEIPPEKEIVKELIHERNFFSRKFELRNGMHQVQQHISLVNYPSGSMRDMRPIDMNAVSTLANRYVFDQSIYKFRQNESGIGFEFESRRGGAGKLTLMNPFRVNRVTSRVLSPRCTELRFIGDDTEVHFWLLPGKVRTWKILRNPNAQRTFIWEWIDTAKGHVTADHIVAGRDGQFLPTKQERFRCEIITNRVDLPNGHVFTEEFTGRVWEKNLRTREEIGLTTDVRWPVKLAGEDITENIAANADDGHGDEGTPEWDVNGGWPFDMHIMGLSDGFHPGYRFQTVNIANGVTVDDATLTIDVTEYRANGSGTMYADDVDDAAAWGDASRPSQMTNTTANTNVSVTAAGTIGVDVQAHIQELVDRAGWAANNDMRFGIVSTSFTPGYEYCEIGDYNGATNPAVLTINYTAGGAARRKYIQY